MSRTEYFERIMCNYLVANREDIQLVHLVVDIAEVVEDMDSDTLQL